MLALWAYPECLVPLSYRLHQELAEQYGGAEKWGYRSVGCGSIGAAVTKDDLQARNAAKDAAQAKGPAPQPGLSALQTGQGDGPSSNRALVDINQETAQPQAASPPTEAGPGGVNGSANGAPVAPLPSSPGHPTAVSSGTSKVAAPKAYTTATFAVVGSSEDDEIKSVDGAEAEETAIKSDKENKEWEKLPKQDAAAASLLQDSPLPTDLDWIDRDLVHHYEEMGRHGFTETSQVHPFHFTTAMAELARSAGVEIRLGAQVTNIVNVSADSKTIEYEDRQHDNIARSLTHVTDVIVTAGPWTGKLLPRSKVEGLRAHSVVYEAEVSPYAVFTDIQLPGDYVPEHRKRLGQRRRHRGNVDPEIYARPFGEVYACGESVRQTNSKRKREGKNRPLKTKNTISDPCANTGEPDKTVPLPETADQVQTDDAQCDDLAAYIATISPALAAAPIRAKQACYLPQHVRFGTERGPLLGPTSTPGVWIAAGHTCWGIQNGPATGYLMAEWILDGEPTAANIDVLHPAKFKV